MEPAGSSRAERVIGVLELRNCERKSLGKGANSSQGFTKMDQTLLVLAAEQFAAVLNQRRVELRGGDVQGMPAHHRVAQPLMIKLARVRLHVICNSLVVVSDASVEMQWSRLPCACSS